MRILIQRVIKARVTTPEGYDKSIKKGLLIFAGIECADTNEDAEWLASKAVNLRIFNDENDVMNKSVLDVDGEILVISQFTLHARTKKGNRPSYMDAAPPDISVPIYEYFINNIESVSGKRVSTGIFGADMQVELINDGPVTIWMDSKQKY